MNLFILFRFFCCFCCCLQRRRDTQKNDRSAESEKTTTTATTHTNRFVASDRHTHSHTNTHTDTQINTRREREIEGAAKERASVVWHKIQCKRKMYAPTYRIMNWDRQAPVIPISSYSLAFFFFFFFFPFFLSLFFSSSLCVCVHLFSLYFVSDFSRSRLLLHSFSSNIRHCVRANTFRYTIYVSLCNLRRPQSKLSRYIVTMATGYAILSTPLLHLQLILLFLLLFSSFVSFVSHFFFFFFIIYFIFVLFDIKFSQVVRASSTFYNSLSLSP